MAHFVTKGMTERKSQIKENSDKRNLMSDGLKSGRVYDSTDALKKTRDRDSRIVITAFVNELLQGICLIDWLFYINLLQLGLHVIEIFFQYSMISTTISLLQLFL